MEITIRQNRQWLIMNHSVGGLTQVPVLLLAMNEIWILRLHGLLVSVNYTD